MTDMVNHPPHYDFGRYETIDVIEAWELPYHLGNVIKYVSRAKRKGREMEDLKKALWYLERYIEKREADLSSETGRFVPSLKSYGEPTEEERKKLEQEYNRAAYDYDFYQLPLFEDD